MKKIVIVFILFVLSYNLFGQSKSELKNAGSILWLGLDFTETRFEGMNDFGAPGDLTDKLIDAWNQLMLQEPEKYNISKFFNYEKVETDFGIAMKKNEQLDPEKLFMDVKEIKEFDLTVGKTQNIVSGYELDYDGYALLFIVESFSKSKANANIWITFFHAPTKEVVLSTKVSAKPGGFGIRNYWAGAVYNVMKDGGKEVKKSM